MLRRARQLRAYERRRAYAFAFLGGACECGATEELEIDHVDPTTKSFDLLGSRWSTRWQKWHDELELCQLLCRECHAAKTAAERVSKRRKEPCECPF